MLLVCREEVTCRFCLQPLPDWKTVLRPPAVGLGPEGKQPTPTMSVTFNGKVRHLCVASALLCQTAALLASPAVHWLLPDFALDAPVSSTA